MTNIIEKPKTNTLIEEYRQQALAYGHEKAIRTFATPMLQAWEKACEGYADEDTKLEGFADLMSEVFNVRDAAIAAAINTRLKIGTIINLARKPTRNTIRGFFPKHLPMGSPTPISNPTTTGYTMPSQPRAVSPTLPRRRSTAPIPLPSPPISHGGTGRWRTHIPTRFSLSMRIRP